MTDEVREPGLIIAGCTAVTVDAEWSVYDPAWIEVRGNRIEQVSESLIPPGPDDRVLDGAGKVVLPGLVNAHTHLWQTLIRGIYEMLPFQDWLAAIYACGRHLSTEDCRSAAMLGGVESLRSGVTTLLDHEFLHRGSEFADATIDGLLDLGIRSVVARTIMDGGDIVPKEIRETPADGLQSVDDLLRRYDSQQASGILTLMTGPNTPGVSASLDLALATAEFCRQNSIRQSMHLAENKTLRPAIRDQYGRDGVVEWLAAHGAIGPETIAAHCVDLSSRDISTLADLGVGVAHNPVSNLCLADGVAPITEMLEAGVTVGLGTDGAASNNSQDMFEVMKFARLLQSVRTERTDAISPMRAVSMATIDGARAVGLDHLVGSIEPGKRADLIMLALRGSAHNVAVHDPVSTLVHTARPPDVETAIVDGRVVLDQGRVVGIDEADLLSHAQQTGESLASRLET